MRRRLPPVLVVAALGVVLSIPAAASAKTWTAYAGSPGKAPAGTPRNAALNQFFPAALPIHVGDSVRFVNNEVHTATFLGKGEKAPALFMPDPSGAAYQGLNDAAGSPFYFNGRPKFLYNVAAFAPVGSKTVGDGKTHSSGLYGKPVGRASVTYKFTKRGSYKLVCLLHPGMTGRVDVVKKSSKAPNAAGLRAQVAREAGRAFANATKAAQSKPPANVVYAGIGDKATILGFLPDKLTVKAGTSVDFVERSASEVHNMVFGPKDYVEQFFKDTDQLPTGPGAPNQFSPVNIFGTDPAENGAYTYNGSNHGNGFLVTPVIDKQPGPPLAETSRITFTTPGTYHYFCAIHGPEMAGDVIVTE
jgi:plastocyanin